MSRRGENIRKRRDGRWEGRYPIYDNDGKKKYRSVYGHSYKEVKEKLYHSKLELKKEQGIKPSQLNSRHTIDEIASSWLKHVASTRKPSTYQKYLGIYHRYLREKVGKKRISDINPDIMTDIIPTTISASLCKSICCVFNQILDYENEHPESVKLHLKACNPYAMPKAISIISISDQKKLVNYLLTDCDNYKLGILICLYMGLRLGEICALKWSDIDFKSKTLHVNRTVQRLNVQQTSKGDKENKTTLYESAPKSLTSIREIPIPNFLYELILSYNPDFKDKIYFLKPSAPMDPRTYQYKFKTYLRKADVKPTRFHSLRHTFATNCISNGADAKSVSEILGHSNVNITLNRYVHPGMEMKRKILNSISYF